MTTILVVLFLFMLLIVIWAFLGKGEEQQQVILDKIPESTLRRRASDKEIEEEFPDSAGHLHRRKDDVESFEEIGKIEGDFNLPYLADEIIPENSKYWIYNRTLVNSEIYASKGDFLTAISLFRGVYERIIDQEINAKIKTNVDYLLKYQKLYEQKKIDAKKQKDSGKTENKIKLSLDGPLNIPEKIQIALTPPAPAPEADITSKIDIDKIVDEIAGKITANNIAEKQSNEEIEKYRSEVDELKDNITRLTDKVVSKGIEVENKDKDIGKYQSELNKLKNNVEQLMEFKDEVEVDKSDPLEEKIQELEDKTKEVSKLKDGIIKLHDRITDVYKEGEKTKEGIEDMKSQLQPAIEESIDMPSVTEAKFQSKGPEIETSLQGEVPAQQPPEPKLVKIPEEKEREKDKIEKVEEVKESEEHVKQKIETDEEDGKEEIELLSQFEKEEELSELSDEDIFEKILKDDITKKDESFEIVGYKDDREKSGGLLDKDHEARQIEEEQFYRRFLRHGKRVRKELPILKVSYDFSKLPDEFSLSSDQNILQYSFFKYKPMLEKANEFIKRKNVRDAINYYKVVQGQNIPPEFKAMLNKNINELTEYIEKYLASD